MASYMRGVTIDGGVIELNAQITEPGFHLIGCEIGAVIGYDAVGNTVTVHNTRYELYNWSGFGRFNWFGLYPFSEFIHHEQQVFFLMASSFKGSNHIEPQNVKCQVMGIVWRAIGGMWL